jgi:hypothetical protein
MALTMLAIFLWIQTMSTVIESLTFVMTMVWSVEYLWLRFRGLESLY